MDILWSNRAETRIDEIFEHISADDPRAALRVCERIEARVRHLSQFPYSDRLGRVENTRELVMADLPYIMVYDVIAILTVRHTAQQWPQEF